MAELAKLFKRKPICISVARYSDTLKTEASMCARRIDSLPTKDLRQGPPESDSYMGHVLTKNATGQTWLRRIHTYGLKQILIGYTNTTCLFGTLG